ncbi:MAG: hypothetical protein INQ03_16670 [Candidatus Heimdallarchaeota archaeon]|nr:hypothetical protein [Candidatus Heimdallarchaeota archaeon]
MKHDERLVKVYNEARSVVDEIIGVTPENYKLLLFVDPSLYGSVLLQTRNAGTPKAIISSNELEVLRELKENNYIPIGTDLVYASRKPKIFLPNYRITSKFDEEVLRAKLIHSFAKATIIEQTKSNFPDTLEKLYRNDAIISDLFMNNVFEFIKERNAPWVWQYFQDFTAAIRLLGLYNQDDFYVPPNTIRNASIFYNYLLEIKDITKERSKAVVKAPLFDLILHGIGDMVLEQYLGKKDDKAREVLEPQLKGNLGQPLGVIGKRFLEEYGENPESIFDTARNMKNDYELVKIWSRGDTKKEIDEVRDKLNNRSIIWHNSKNSFWSDLWPLRASVFDKVSNAYVGKLQRRKYQLYSDLLDDSPLVTTHGRVKLKDREVAVMSIQEDTIGQEQLLILRNHLKARKDTFSTPLPGLPDIVVFKKFSGMHVASYLGVADKVAFKKYPNSPYDLPLVVRALQVTKKKDAYLSEERDDEGKIDTADYSNLEKLTEPQHRAIKYLIRQSEVTQ